MEPDRTPLPGRLTEALRLVDKLAR